MERRVLMRGPSGKKRWMKVVGTPEQQQKLRNWTAMGALGGAALTGPRGLKPAVGGLLGGAALGAGVAGLARLEPRPQDAPADHRVYDVDTDTTVEGATTRLPPGVAGHMLLGGARGLVAGAAGGLMLAPVILAESPSGKGLLRDVPGVAWASSAVGGGVGLPVGLAGGYMQARQRQERTNRPAAEAAALADGRGILVPRDQYGEFPLAAHKIRALKEKRRRNAAR